ncbi:BON domain-containing protein [Rhizobium sp. LjRoot98]|uniref:BON domain-containing protein n=1 Tax=unclassified Rhizobium TaxID=2613769 RepID=UPI0007148590|nr:MULTISPECIES: BON domain-containing protein [unclassified Rhizobium]KQV42281.1 transporter [Rhizobium sp. Root1204]KQY18178.1 transporter [Rhizobium sp. Root1334]KRB98480.1 transporter [Rhizobium sp. Root73]
MHKQIYIHQDDHSDLTDDELASKVMRYIQYSVLIDTSGLSVMAVGRTVILSGYVSCAAEVGCIEQAAASVIGVHLVENTVEVMQR